MNDRAPAPLYGLFTRTWSAWCRVFEVTLRLALVRISSAVLVHPNGWHRSFQASMKVSMAPMRSLTEVNVPRQIAWRVMIPKNTSTRFSHDPEVGVKCIRTGGCLDPPMGRNQRFSSEMSNWPNSGQVS